MALVPLLLGVFITIDSFFYLMDYTLQLKMKTIRLLLSLTIVILALFSAGIIGPINASAEAIPECEGFFACYALGCLGGQEPCATYLCLDEESHMSYRMCFNSDGIPI